MPDDRTRYVSAPDKPAWFGVAGPIAAWIALGIGDIFVTWRACLHQADFGGPSAHPVARAIYFIITFAFLAVVIVASAVTWRRLSGIGMVMHAEGSERPEFMTLAGMFIGLTLGAGIAWFCIPIFVLQMCLRAR